MADSGETADAVDTGEAKQHARPKADRVSALEATVEQLTGLVESMAGQLAQPMAPSKLSTATSPTQQLARATEVQEFRKHIYDREHPRAPAVGLGDGDIVQLKEDCERGGRYRKGLNLLPEQPLPLGVIQTFLYVHKNGFRKYKVEFYQAGTDGCTEDELELVSKAS